MAIKSVLYSALGFVTLTLGLAVPCNAWQGDADNIASAAAASVVLYSLCDLAAAPRVAQQAAALLRSHARRLAEGSSASTANVTTYLLESANRKVNAFWATNQAQGCAGASRLRDIAQPFNFPLPR